MHVGSYKIGKHGREGRYKTDEETNGHEGSYKVEVMEKYQGSMNSKGDRERKISCCNLMSDMFRLYVSDAICCTLLY